MINIHVGVYLSHNGVVIEPYSNILITEVGTSSIEQPVVCTTDRMPCCLADPQYGEWYFPDGGRVFYINAGAVAFHRNRDNNGNVNLLRVSSDVMSPTGNFCCVVPDATNMNQTVCVNLGEPNCTARYVYCTTFDDAL